MYGGFQIGTFVWWWGRLCVQKRTSPDSFIRFQAWHLWHFEHYERDFFLGCNQPQQNISFSLLILFLKCEQHCFPSKNDHTTHIFSHPHPPPNIPSHQFADPGSPENCCIASRVKIAGSGAWQFPPRLVLIFSRRVIYPGLATDIDPHDTRWTSVKQKNGKSYCWWKESG